MNIQENITNAIKTFMSSNNAKPVQTNNNDNSLYSQYMDWQSSADFDSTFDFLQDKDFNSDEEYFGQIFELANGEVDKSDLNKDGKVTYEEYIEAEKNAAEEEYGPEVAETITLENYEDLLQTIDYNNDGELSATEFAMQYWVADMIGGEDGKFTLEEVSMAVDVFKYSSEDAKELIYKTTDSYKEA